MINLIHKKPSKITSQTKKRQNIWHLKLHRQSKDVKVTVPKHLHHLVSFYFLGAPGTQTRASAENQKG